MSAHVLLNLLNELGKGNKMQDLPCILLLFHKFNKFNNTGAQMLDSIYYMTFKLLSNHILALNRKDLAIFYTTLKWT